jgi:hypothetical protein
MHSLTFPSFSSSFLKDKTRWLIVVPVDWT